jgi:hypothetical protein
LIRHHNENENKLLWKHLLRKITSNELFKKAALLCKKF